MECSLCGGFPCVSLQVGSERRQSDGTKVLDVMPDYPDWAETAALIAACGASYAWILA